MYLFALPKSTFGDTTKRVSDREPEIFTRHLAGTKASKSISL